MMTGDLPTRMTGVKSRCGSNVRSLYISLLVAAVPVVAKSSVYPSGRAFAARPPAMLPPAPPRLSMGNGWPKALARCSVTPQASTSEVVPAVNGTITLTGRVGQTCAGACAIESERKKRGEQQRKSRHGEYPQGSGCTAVDLVNVHWSSTYLCAAQAFSSTGNRFCAAVSASARKRVCHSRSPAVMRRNSSHLWRY